MINDGAINNNATFDFVNDLVDSTATTLQNNINGKLSATQSKASNGYCKLSNGIIIQWGSFNQTGNNVVTFPTPFSSSNYSVSVCYFYDTTNESTGANLTDWSIRSKTKTNFTSNYLNRGKTKMWIAIGY